MHVCIDSPTANDGPSILQLVRNSGLPTDGLIDRLHTTIVARDGDDIVGCAALEVYPDGALLRSVAVAEAAKGRGVGTQLTRSALDLARSRGVPAVYLLTTTAERFFPRFAFEPITRGQVPATVQSSVEFQSACPASAIVMSCS